MSEQRQHLTIADLAMRLGVSTSAVYTMNSRGTGPSYVKLGHRSVRYRLADVERWERERTVNHGPDAA